MQLTSFMRSILFRATFVKRAPSKSIMTTPRKMQEVLEDLKGNPYYDKYAAKISQLQKEDPNEFKNRVESVDKKISKKIEPSKERQYSQLLKPKESINNPAQFKHEPLDKIMKIDLIKDKTADEVKLIWEQYHLQKDYCIAATIPAKDFVRMNENSTQFPTFLFAIPRSQGYEFIMCQFAQNSVHFTPLLCYQVHKENAPECLTITHYDEFKDSKEIVLMRGEYDKNVIDAREAQCLANQLQMYYVQDEPEKRKLLETFTRKPDKFKHMDLIKQIENISLT
ncbi:ATP synthase mitochondrial F1 complex assembly factor 1 [Anoplophora glabripennis]|uniref:ATP synthase mitochondrial F1 complex assembly factor 1 n=1 Tax=Anoplophora glabripennis TaxID=217634 RepID=V5GKY4_ANOGL|nr:ATP synthase mitochondrial F1 complex assembly factor 1 [Anoplophora glabripennis]